jgi:hypothetical protein
VRFWCRKFYWARSTLTGGSSNEANISLPISHFRVFAPGSGAAMVRSAEKRFMAGRDRSVCPSLDRFVVKRATFTGMLPSGRLVHDPSGWALS